MPILPRLPVRPRGTTATGALLALALVLAGAVAWQAHAAARAHRAAAERLLHDHAAYAASEFVRRAGSTLEAAFVTLQYQPTDVLEGEPADTPLLSADEYRRAVREQDTWCDCLGDVDRLFALDLRTDSLQVAGAALDGDAEAWLRREVRAHADWLKQNPRESSVSSYGQVEGRTATNRYQIRMQRTTARLRNVEGGMQALAFTVLFDDRDSLRAAYGLLDDPARFAVPVFQRVAGRVPLLPASVMRGAPNDSLLRVTVVGPGGGVLWRSADAGPGAARADEPFPTSFPGLTARVELRPEAAAWLLEGGLPASPLPMLLGLLAVTAGVVAVAFAQLRRQHALARLRADFVSGVSHELRTPLTQIRLFSELLLGGRLRTDEECDRSLRLIDREARRLSFLVENVLDFSRAERGTLRIAPAPADVAAAAEEVVDGFAPLARARGMSLRTELERGAVAPIDPGAFRQVLLNFLENAVKYGPAGQTITIGAARRGDAVRVWVEDGGPGIPPRERERIWEPYHRLDREIDGVVGGSGIGLSVVRELVARHGGRTWVEDGDTGGARFVAEFPAGSRGEPGDAPEVLRASPSSSAAPRETSMAGLHTESPDTV